MYSFSQYDSSGGKRMIYSTSLTQGPRPSLFSFLLNGRIRITTITVSELLLLGGTAMSTLGSILVVESKLR